MKGLRHRTTKTMETARDTPSENVFLGPIFESRTAESIEEES